MSEPGSPRDDGAAALPAFLSDLQAIVAAVLTPDGRVLQGNRGFWRALGERGEDLAGPGARWCQAPTFAELTDGPPAAEPYRGRITLGDPTGAGRTVHGTVGRFGDGWLLVGELDVAGNERLAERVLELNRDLAERQRELARANRLLKQREQELVELSNSDPLTGLPNRRHLLERLGQEVARSGRTGDPLSVAMIDLDDFKGINDEDGHAAGDRVLRAVAAALREGLRPYDVAGRLGGDEFALVLPGADADAAEALCGRVLDRLARVPRGGGGVRATSGAASAPADGRGAAEGGAAARGSLRASLGVATLAPAAEGADGRRAGELAESLLSRADTALYRAKGAGGGQVRGDPGLRDT